MQELVQGGRQEGDIDEAKDDKEGQGCEDTVLPNDQNAHSHQYRSYQHHKSHCHPCSTSSCQLEPKIPRDQKQRLIVGSVCASVHCIVRRCMHSVEREEEEEEEDESMMDSSLPHESPRLTRPHACPIFMIHCTGC